MNGFVYIIESPSPSDLLDGRTEGRALSEVLQLAEIPFTYSLASDIETFRTALGARLVKAWLTHAQPPVLHLSMHGNEDGIQLTCGTFIRWSELRDLLQPLATALNGGLLICMSSCFGAAGCRMAMHEGPDPTFWTIVGHAGEARWADAAVAYICFYHLFFKGVPLDECVLGMRVASRDSGFLSLDGAGMKRSWQEELPQIKRDALLAMLRADGALPAHQDPPRDAG